MRNCAVSEMISSRCTVVKLSGTRTTPLPVSPLSFLIVFSISAGSCTCAMIARTLYFAADSMNGREKNVPESGTEFELNIWATQLRHQLFQHRKIFPCDACVQDCESGDVAARTRHARDESAADRIGNRHEYDRNCPSRMHQRRHNGRAVAHDAVGLELHQSSFAKACMRAESPSA